MGLGWIHTVANPSHQVRIYHQDSSNYTQPKPQICTLKVTTPSSRLNTTTNLSFRVWHSHSSARIGIHTPVTPVIDQQRKGHDTIRVSLPSCSDSLVDLWSFILRVFVRYYQWNSGQSADYSNFLCRMVMGICV